MLLEAAPGAEQGRIRRLAHRRHRTLKAVGQRLAIELGELRLWIEEVHVTGTAVEEAPNHALGFGTDVRRLRGAGRLALLLKKCEHGQAAATAAGTNKEIATGESGL